MPKVTIYTQAYNPGPYLEPCVESVLGQTYTDFEWILIDHGSTDETPAIIDRYAEKDKRIIPIHIAVNGSVPNLLNDTLRQRAAGKYLAWLDSDDWWDPDYLEKLVPFAEENDLDLALTGAVQYFQEQGVSSLMRQMNEPVLLTADGFARNFPIVGPFAGAMWANLRLTEKVLAQDGDPLDYEVWLKGLTWRTDTLHMLNYADHCQRIGVNEFAPYHYRRYGTSLSRQYNDTYFEANTYFYHRLEAFFQKHGVLDEPMREYLNQRYFFEMTWSLEVLKNAPMPAGEKLRVCAQMAGHPLTVQALSHPSKDQEQWRSYIRDITELAIRSGELDLEVLRELLRLLAPDCRDVVTEPGAALFARERDLLALLFQNRRSDLSKRLLELAEGEGEPLDLGAMLRNALPEGSPLRAVEDVRFFRHYPKLTRLILGSGYLAALDQMTALLLEEKPLESEESFLQLYLTLAALENQPSAFVFGKVRLAKLYQTQRRKEACQAALRDLEEMGAGDLPEVLALKENCKKEGLP